MKIKDRPEFNRKGETLTFAPNVMVSTAVREMSEKNYGAAVIIGEDQKPLGIVTERDFMRRLLKNNLDQNVTALSAIMTTDLRLAKADDDLLDWLRQMSNDRFRHLPVVNDNGELIGLMSQGDFVSYTWPQLFERVREQARATFDVNPSIFFGLGTIIFIALIGIAALVVSK